jgi:aspartate/methionine/tyrosine aminotransferase
MLDTPLAPYLFWAKTRRPAAIDLAGSNLLPCSLDDLPGAREAVDLAAPNDNGFAPLVDAIAASYGVEPARIATATGCSGANFLVAAALLAAGDDVLIERPTYDPLIGACRLVGANVNRFDRRFDDGYRVDVDAVAAAMTPETRLIVVTSPHNPTGVTIDRETLAALGRLADHAGASVLVDEVYLDGANGIAGTALPAAATLDGPFISTSSLTKSYGLAGLRSGWAVAPLAMAERLRRTRDVVDNASSGPADRLAAHAFTQLPALAARAQRLIGQNVGTIRRFLNEHPALEVAARPGSSVVFPRVAGLADAGPFIQRLLDDYGVAVAPGYFFDAPGHFRIGLAGDPARLVQGLAAIGQAIPGVAS